MRKRSCSVGTMLLMFLVTVICWANPGMNEANSGGDDSVSPRWTFLFYLAADNEQEAYADATIAQLLAGTADVENHPQIIVLIDRLSSDKTEVFEVVGGEVLSLATYAEQYTAGEQNTADGAVLEDFVTYALGLAEHENVVFVMKSEGLSWRGIGRDNTHDEEIDDQLMPTGDLADALVAAQVETKKDIDLLVLEGSLMAFIEVVYELRDAAPVLLATQSKIQPDGLPWAMVIEELGETPGMTSTELGIAITDNHIEYYSDKGNNGVPNLDTSINFAAMTVFDLSHIMAVRDAHITWAEITWDLFDDIYNILPHARDLSDVGGYGDITDFDYQSDIKTFMLEGLRLIDEAGLNFSELKVAVDDYLAEQNKLIVYEQSPEDGFKLQSANGLSIWYPPTWNKYETSDENDEVFGSTMHYEDPEICLDWVCDSNWITYLFEYFDRADANLAGNGPDGDEPPKPGVVSDKVN
ncbi:MAG: clostripain-related cysteine peptidase [Deltaproteobacteria bacterium]|nr:clostripain-related cysteine peptidase [Deltaproteobacteria bacterium]